MTKILKTIKKKIHSTHDSFFKHFYSDPKLAQELLSLIFSKEEQKAYLLDKVKIEKDTFEGKSMDLVLSVPFKDFPNRRLELFILLEHKSHYDKNLFEQVLGYLFLIRKAFIQQRGSPRPVLAVLFYHGKAPLKWKNSLQEEDFQGFFEKIPLETRKNMLNYGLRIINTQDPKIQRACKDKGFKGRGVIKLLSEVWDTKKPSPSKLEKFLFDFKDLLESLEGERRDETILQIYQYLRNNTGLEEKAWKKAEAWLIEQGFLTEGGVMTIREQMKEQMKEQISEQMKEQISEQIRENARWEGRQEGLQEGRQQVILNMLKEKIDTSVISKVTGLSEKEIKKLQNES